jgi:hypothetical protein
MLGHEKLNVYQRSVEFFALALQVNGKIQGGNSILTDQLKRGVFLFP